MLHNTSLNSSLTVINMLLHVCVSRHWMSHSGFSIMLTSGENDAFKNTICVTILQVYLGKMNHEMTYWRVKSGVTSHKSFQ